MMRMTHMHGWVACVGAGPGNEGLLTIRAVRLLGAAALVVAEPEIADRVRHLLHPEAEITEPSDPAGTTRTLLQAANAGRLAVRLYAGDPLLNGAAPEVQACAKAKARFEIVPGVPAATGVPAYAGIALTDNGGELRVIHASEANRL